jgi:hypothetical protein
LHLSGKCLERLPGFIYAGSKGSIPLPLLLEEGKKSAIAYASNTGNTSELGTEYLEYSDFDL